MRITPNEKYHGFPCVYVGTGCAFEDYFQKDFFFQPAGKLRGDGWSTLENTNKYVRSLLPIKKKVYYKRGERMKLSAFLENNTEKCLVCVYGHFIYVSCHDYWSFFENENDDVVCVWYIKSKGESQGETKEKTKKKTQEPIEVIKNYLEKEKALPLDVFERMIIGFKKNTEIAEEFVFWIKTKEYKADSPLQVEGYTAEDVFKMAPFLDGLGVFNFLITLREQPEKAKAQISAGFPRK